MASSRKKTPAKASSGRRLPRRGSSGRFTAAPLPVFNLQKLPPEIRYMIFDFYSELLENNHSPMLRMKASPLLIALRSSRNAQDLYQELLYLTFKKTEYQICHPSVRKQSGLVGIPSSIWARVQRFKVARRRPESGIVDAITDAVTSGHSQIRELCIGFSIDKKKLQDCLAQVLPHLRHITKLSVRTYKPVDGCTHRLWQRWCLRPVDYIHHDGRHSFVYNMNKHLEVEGVITKQTPGHSAREVVWTARKGTTLVWKSEGHGCEE